MGIYTGYKHMRFDRPFAAWQLNGILAAQRN